MAISPLNLITNTGRMKLIFHSWPHWTERQTRGTKRNQILPKKSRVLYRLIPFLKNIYRKHQYCNIHVHCIFNQFASKWILTDRKLRMNRMKGCAEPDCGQLFLAKGFERSLGSLESQLKKAHVKVSDKYTVL